jgi:Leucine-rich repeat (LRR) protein
MPVLRELDVGFNMLSKIPSSFSGLKNLQILDAQHNKLKVKPLKVVSYRFEFVANLSSLRTHA